VKGESRNDSVRAMISHRMCCGSFGAGPKNVCVRKCVCVYTAEASAGNV